MLNTSMSMRRRRTVQAALAALAALAACCGAAASFTAAAADWQPSKPVRIIVPFAPGVSPDVVARILSEPLAKAIGQPVVIDNRPGAAGIIGADAAAKSAPDGTTLFLTVNSIMGINPNVYSKLPYDTFRDFVPVTQVVLVPYVLVTGADQPYRTLKDLLAKAKEKPEAINYGSLGIGSGPHVVMEMMNNMAGVKMTHIPCKGNPLNEVIAGQVGVYFDPITTALPMVKSGRVRALAVTSKSRVAQMPDVPAVAETLPGYDGDGWQGFYLPAKTAPDIVARYHREISKILQQPDVRARLVDVGLQPVGSTPDEFAVVSRREVEKWGRIARENNIRVD